MPLLTKARTVIGEMNGSVELNKFLESQSIDLDISVGVEKLQGVIDHLDKKLEEYKKFVALKYTLTTLVNEMNKAGVDEVYIYCNNL